MYARERVIPRITNTDEEKLATFYADLRKESLVKDEERSEVLCLSFSST